MEMTKTFIRGTKISSRVLFVLWFAYFLYIIFVSENILIDLIGSVLVFLLPAATNELRKNPVFIQSQSTLL